MFSCDLIKAINDWQRGGSPQQKQRRGLALKHASAGLPSKYRSTMLVCFRQISLDPSAVWQLHERLELSETISSWTLSTDVAIAFKGGVPPEGLPGLILDIVPPPNSVVVNLDALYRDPEFNAKCEAAREQIFGFANGIGRYGNSQNEIVLELDSVPISSVYALGGHSSSREAIGKLYFGHEPSDQEWEEFSALEAQAGDLYGPRWITGAAKDRVLARTLKAYGIIKNRQEAVDDH